MKAELNINQVNYFGNINNANYNAKALYTKNGKTYLAYFYIDFFNKSIRIPKQPKEGKIVSNFNNSILDYANKTNWFFQ